LQKQIASLVAKTESQSHETNKVVGEIKNLKDQLDIVSSSVNSLWNPKNWFNDQQREYRKQASAIKSRIGEKETVKSKIECMINEFQANKRAKEDELRRYNSFDLGVNNAERSRLTEEINSGKQKVEQLLKRKKDVDSALEPVIQQIHELERKKSDAQNAKSRAQRFDADLSNARNSYEKAMVHKNCENEFGVGSPKKVIVEKDRELMRLERDLEKLEKRAKSIAEKAAREIRQIIVDGNNLCYNGDKFIGLDVLRVLIPILSKSYRIKVVFDASIRRILQSGDTEIRGIFGNKVEVHVVATNSKADETVLDLANENAYTFVLSNDRFGEFNDKTVVKNARIVRHEIVGGRVMIHDLGISEVYNARG
jgi:rRNA-processing protein FCF1/uncharacterized protein YoxC